MCGCLIDIAFSLGRREDAARYGIRSVQIVALKESVRGNDFIATFSGCNHSAAITAAGQVFTWGANDMKQLGYPGAEEGILGIDMDPRPVGALQGSVVISASCGKHHTAVITEDGHVFTWGAFGNGQLGIGEVSRDKFPFGYVDGPTKVHALDTAAPRSVACGFFHTVIIDGLGDIWTCGTGDHGVHGHEHHFDQPVPLILQSIHGHDFRQVACGASHTVALTAQGHIYAWGMNEHGQLGLGDTITRRQPVLNSACTGKNISKISCGEAHTAYLSDRDVFTFGDGSHGALGHGNSKSHLVPKSVLFFIVSTFSMRKRFLRTSSSRERCLSSMCFILPIPSLLMPAIAALLSIRSLGCKLHPISFAKVAT